MNKALEAIGEDGYNYVQMNFSLTNPYKPTIPELIYKYRYTILISVIVLSVISFLFARLRYTQKEHKRLSLDPLTGAFSEAGFELAVAKIMHKASKPLYITDFDICLFSSYNELNGKAEGDALLKNIVRIVKSLICEQDVICRAYADHFIVLASKDSLEALIEDISMAFDSITEAAKSTIMVKFGVYPVTDKNVPIDKMLDFAAMAKRSIKDDSSTFVNVFDEGLLERYVSDAKMISAFQAAIEQKEFVAYYQPKFDAAKKTVVGAEALVRWVSSDGTLIPPCRFIELFEKSGQIQQLDLYMLEEACLFLQGLREKGIPMLPIAVNFSRVHLHNREFLNEVNEIVDRYNIPKHFIEIEFTETTMLNNTDL
ncbi:MAG: EAL domain-containing protein, partial [Eubacterium sp.]